MVFPLFAKGTSRILIRWSARRRSQVYTTDTRRWDESAVLTMTGENEEEKEAQRLFEEFGLSQEEPIKEQPSSNALSPAVAVGLGAALLVNVGLLFSLPPVLRGRGTYAKNFENSVTERRYLTRKTYGRLTVDSIPLDPLYRRSFLAYCAQQNELHVCSTQTTRAKISTTKKKGQAQREAHLCRLGEWGRTTCLSSCQGTQNL